jgi:acetyltransferase-like isoleucine patch superfamily enzyme
MNLGKYSYAATPLIITNKYDDTTYECGKFCSIARNLTICLGGNHHMDWVSTYPFGHRYTNVFNTFVGEDRPLTKGNVVIGNDIWIGDNVTIMSGVHIGDGAVIANSSHVCKDVAPYTIVGGNPAKFIKRRFTEAQIERLMEIKWWDWTDAEINQVAPALCNPDIDGFIAIADAMIRIKQLTASSTHHQPVNQPPVNQSPN